MCADGFLPDTGRDVARRTPPGQVLTEHPHSDLVVAVPAPRQQMASWAFGPQKGISLSAQRHWQARVSLFLSGCAAVVQDNVAWRVTEAFLFRCVGQAQTEREAGHTYSVVRCYAGHCAHLQRIKS